MSKIAYFLCQELFPNLNNDIEVIINFIREEIRTNNAVFAQWNFFSKFKIY